MNWSDGLAEPHLSIAASDHPRIGVLAGPGTGKTTYGLMRRIARLIEQGVTPERILLLSFTRVAAGDLRDKIAKLNVDDAEKVRASTVHAYCFGLLRQDGVLRATGRNPRILLRHETDLMLRDLGGEFGRVSERRKLLGRFVAGWAKGIEDHPGTAELPRERQFEITMIKWLRTHRAMLIGEVVPIANTYLRSNPTAEELEAFDHVIVDEYQDLNAIEQDLVERIASNGSLCIAGDDDQSIYGFKNANPDGILAFVERQDVENYAIEVCGRCPEPILSAANSLIACAPNRGKGEMSPRSPEDGGVMAIVQWPSIQEEAAGLVQAIADDIAAGKRNPGDFLVLTGRRNIAQPITDKLLGVGIPAETFFGEEELASEEAKRSFALLRLVVDPADSVAVRVLVSLGDQQGRTTGYQQLLAYCASNRSSPLETLSLAAKGGNLGFRIPAIVQRYEEAMAKVGELSNLSTADLVDEIFPEERSATADLRALALEALAEDIEHVELLDQMIEAITQEVVPQDPEFVRVMSLHKSKGLTSPVVLVAGAINGILPMDPTDDVAVEEARRLFYVGITRAADELVISSAEKMELSEAMGFRVAYDPSSVRSIDGTLVVQTIASPYVAELGPNSPDPVKGSDWAASR